MDFTNVQWFSCNFILQFNFLFYHKPLDFVGDLCYIFSDVCIYMSCKQQVVGSSSIQAQCNLSSEELHWVSHGVIGWKCQYFTLNSFKYIYISLRCTEDPLPPPRCTPNIPQCTHGIPGCSEHTLYRVILPSLVLTDAQLDPHANHLRPNCCRNATHT